MKIYFVGSITGKKEFSDNYENIVSILKKLGHEVFEITLEPSKKYVYGLSDSEKVRQYKRVLQWISKADVIVAEASHSSMGVGYEISLALEKGKPVVVLYEKGHAPHFLEGLKSDKLIVSRYELDGVEDVLENALEFSAEQVDTRFNFFISRKISSYLDWISKKRRIPRAVYLRQLITREMRNFPEFKL